MIYKFVLSGRLADHCYQKGPIRYVVSDELKNQLTTGEIFRATAGMSYEVSDELSPHRSHTETGTTLFMID